MRDGPLAALFRHSEGEGGAGEPATDPARTGARPEERLAQVFSPDIPENIMDRSGPQPQGGRDVIEPGHPPVIRVVGVGGAGVNAVNRMVEAGLDGVEFIAVNTDFQSLEGSSAHVTLHIGGELTGGLGSGSDLEVGRQAAIEDHDSLKRQLTRSDMVFITAGAGGGTGTGAAPVIARIARELGALCVGIVTKPFAFEGSRRRAQAEVGVEALSQEVDTLIVIPN
ncbi:MAG: cell division protein FtsZ, partial [Actinomycetota bacterium]|nr:cell division protein FtsZ [Actinomycetota bacterium]